VATVNLRVLQQLIQSQKLLESAVKIDVTYRLIGRLTELEFTDSLFIPVKARSLLLDGQTGLK
jgi:hypothetical protein